MNWYYAENGQQQGPVDDAALADLAARGVIRPDTLVWNETMSQWAPLAKAAPGVLAPAPASAAADATGGTGTPCAECGRLFPEDQVVRIGEKTVCAGCKPLALRKMQEGVAPAPELAYAGFWIRFGAFFIDRLILTVFMVMVVVAAVLLVVATGGKDNPAVLIPVIIFGYALLLLLPVAYDAYFISKYGATWGKMAVGIRVVRPDGSNVLAGRAIGRGFARLLTDQTLTIGYIIAGFDSEKRSLHDHLCGTRVVYK